MAQVAQIGCGVTSLEILKSHLDMILDTLLWVSLLEQGLERMTQRSLPSLPMSAIL